MAEIRLDAFVFSTQECDMRAFCRNRKIGRFDGDKSKSGEIEARIGTSSWCSIISHVHGRRWGLSTSISGGPSTKISHKSFPQRKTRKRLLSDQFDKNFDKEAPASLARMPLASSLGCCRAGTAQKCRKILS